MYVDYSYYLENYSGKVKQEEFNVIQSKAASILNRYTFNRIKDVDVDVNVKMAVCELMDNIKDGEMKDVISESVGSHSKTYANKSNSTKNTQREIIHRWIPARLLYRGVLYDDKF